MPPPQLQETRHQQLTALPSSLLEGGSAEVSKAGIDQLTIQETVPRDLCIAGIGIARSVGK